MGVRRSGEGVRRHGQIQRSDRVHPASACRAANPRCGHAVSESEQHSLCEGRGNIKHRDRRCPGRPEQQIVADAGSAVAGFRHARDAPRGNRLQLITERTTFCDANANAAALELHCCTWSRECCTRLGPYSAAACELTLDFGSTKDGKRGIFNNHQYDQRRCSGS